MNISALGAFAGDRLNSWQTLASVFSDNSNTASKRREDSDDFAGRFNHLAFVGAAAAVVLASTTWASGVAERLQKNNKSDAQVLLDEPELVSRDLKTTLSRSPESAQIKTEKVVTAPFRLPDASADLDTPRVASAINFVLSDKEPVSERVTALLGGRVAQRLNEFRQLTEDWDGAGARALQPSSVAQFLLFFSELPSLRELKTALFMSHDGNLLANWLDENRKVIEAEFFGDRLEIFLEEAGATREFRSGSINTARRFLESLLKR